MIQALTPEQTANILQVNVATIYQMIKNGDLPARRIGEKQFRISPLTFSWIWGPIDGDLKMMEFEDRKNLAPVEEAIKKVRSKK